MLDNTRYDYSAIIQRPPLRWPGNARVAVWVIPNIEHFKIDMPATTMTPDAHPPVPDVRSYAWRDYGARVGVWRIMEVLDKYGIRATVALNAEACQRYAIIIQEAVKRRWVFMGHGLTNSQRLTNLPVDAERQIVRETIAVIKQATGQAPMGWLGPGLTETFETPDLLAEEGIRYVCDWCADDQPFPMKVRRGTLLSIPYTLELNDLPVCVGKGASAEEFYRICCDQFDCLYEEGAQNGRVMALALHPYIIGQPFRIKYLDRILGYISRHKEVWLTTGDEIADWYLSHYLEQGRGAA
jgi:peptidoglycan/xylan/chitin deacetylase (PgdA/CDA1 family)